MENRWGTLRSYSHIKQAWSNSYGYLIIFTITFLSRTSLDGPRFGGDSSNYLNLAANMVVNGCYSAADPASQLCSPTWGGQPPGYPVFLAFLTVIFGNPLNSVVYVQSLLYSSAVVYALYCVSPFRQFRAAVITVGLLLALSPLTIPWPGWVLTESLAATASLWLAAECLRSLSSGQFRTTAISISFSMAVLIRWDLVGLLALVAVVSYQLLGRVSVFRMALIILVSSVPLSLMMIRAVAVGLTPLPPSLSDQTPQNVQGVIAFWRAAAIKGTSGPALLWRVWNKDYSLIEPFDYSSFSSRVDTYKLQPEIHALARLPHGSSVPPAIDQKFANLAKEFIADNTLYVRLLLPVERSYRMWVKEDVMMNSGWVFGPPIARWEPFRTFYRLLLLGLTLLGMMYFWPDPTLRPFYVGVLLFIALRMLFLVSLTALETRYLMAFFPIMELSAALFAIRWIQGARHAEVEFVDKAH